VPQFATTPDLEIAYEATGPDGGQTVVCVHGWPDSPHCWDTVRTLLHDAGCRVYTPSLRGFSTTRFRDGKKPRSGQIGALGRDLADFLDALGLDDVLLVGHDWGARAAYTVAALFPQRLRGLVALSTGYGTNSPDYAIPFDLAHAFWYQWFVATERGRAALREDRRALGRYLWKEWTPGWRFSEQDFAEAARTWDNDDWAEITIHGYLHRWGEAPGDPAYDEIEARLAACPPIAVPTLVVHGAADPGNPANTSAGREHMFTGDYRRIELPGVGHLVPREAPEELVHAILDLLSRCSGDT
jgi:pimeloyl-ACP methyl ester carboxylesterase